MDEVDAEKRKTFRLPGQIQGRDTYLSPKLRATRDTPGRGIVIAKQVVDGSHRARFELFAYASAADRLAVVLDALSAENPQPQPTSRLNEGGDIARTFLSETEVFAYVDGLERRQRFF